VADYKRVEWSYVAGWFEITHERVPQIWTFINSKLKFLVLNELRRGAESCPSDPPFALITPELKEVQESPAMRTKRKCLTNEHA